jgi:hypothetical protein
LDDPQHHASEQVIRVTEIVWWFGMVAEPLTTALAGINATEGSFLAIWHQQQSRDSFIFR